MKKLGLRLQLKGLRKTGATLLKGQAKRFPSCSGYWLGHSPKTVEDKNYAAPSQQLLDQAVTWLGKKLKLYE
jgi:hypothetical protein